MMKNLLLKLLVILSAFSFVYFPYSVLANSNADNKDYLNPQNSYSAVRSSYHSTMNEFFDSKIRTLNNLFEEEEFYNDEKFLVPKNVDINNYKEKCGDDNVSTFCVSMQALDIYLNYTNTLSQMRDKVEVREGELNLLGLYALSSSRNADIINEIEKAEKVLNLTISAYNEYRSAYPIHLKNLEIIKNLKKYKRSLTMVRIVVSAFPSKFIDASSPYCN